MNIQKTHIVFVLRPLAIIIGLTITTTFASAQVHTDTVSTIRQGGGFFTGGNASVTRIETPAAINCGVATVSFPAGVRTIWHSHAGGQVIVVISGTAWYQEKGKSKQIIPQGGTIVCPPNVMHWHGASANAPMVHTVATPNIDRGGATGGTAVTEQEYKAVVN